VIVKTCAQMTCPSGRSWADIPTSASKAHALAECSDRGKCNRQTGNCECFSGFTGASCNRMVCPGTSGGIECSGHGRCVATKYLAGASDAMPLSYNTLYGSNGVSCNV
jgi:hypothetical protein